MALEFAQENDFVPGSQGESEANQFFAEFYEATARRLVGVEGAAHTPPARPAPIPGGARIVIPRRGGSPAWRHRDSLDRRG